MTKLFEKISLKLIVVIIGLTIVLSSCEESSGEWEKEEIKTDYGDYFEHYYRFVPGGFNDPEYEHRILYNGKELLSYMKEHEDSSIECIYTDEKLIVYEIYLDLFYRKIDENTFHSLPIDVKEKEFYPVYYRLILQTNKYVRLTKMLLTSDDIYTKKIVMMFANGDFSEAEKKNIFMTPSEIKSITAVCSELAEEYQLIG